MTEWEWQLLEERTPVESVRVSGVDISRGGFVRLRPRAGGDIFDLALAGQVAVVESIEQDYEGKIHLAVVLDDDPGKDLGLLRQPGHRFFFTPEEVEPVEQPVGAPATAASSARMLVAGIGNIFLGDDGFGVEVIRRLAQQDFPANVHIRDFGIRAYDLAYALLEDYAIIILVDAAPRGEAPGTIHVIEPDVNQDGSGQEMPLPDAHSMNPGSVLRLANAMGTVGGRILVVGCEPGFLGGDEGEIGLSGPVSEAVGEAADVVRRLLDGLLSGRTVAQILKPS